jgi:[acyl-carrier-protein] S-malonyltransferase
MDSPGDARLPRVDMADADMAATAPVAVVGGRPIPIARLRQRIAEVRRGPRGKHLPPEGGSDSVRLGRWIVQDLVTEAVLVHEARAAGIVCTESDTNRAPDGGSTVGLSPEVVAHLLERVTASVAVPTRDVRSYYVRNGDLYRRPEARRVRHILLADEGSAQRVARRILAGEDMGALAESLSIDTGSRPQVGVLGEVHRGEFSGPLEDAIFGGEAGAVIGPIATEHGWHVARVEAVTPATCVPYAEARIAIKAELLAAARTREFAAWLGSRRATLAVIEPEFEHPAHPMHGFPSHRH